MTSLEYGLIASICVLVIGLIFSGHRWEFWRDECSRWMPRRDKKGRWMK